MEKLLLKPAEVAELLGVARTRAYELIGSGKLPTVTVGSSVRVPAEALRRWVEENTSQGATPNG
jgi:excisionase family DNA binding protein